MTNMRLDVVDVRILSAVQKHGTLSKTKLAELVNLSPTPCWARLDKLKKAGLIRGYKADIAIEAIADVTQVVVTVSLSNHRKIDFVRFETRIDELTEITECVATGGGMDYVMRVVAPNLEHFQQLMDKLLSEELGIDRYFTYIVTKTVKSAQPNLEQLIVV